MPSGKTTINGKEYVTYTNILYKTHSKDPKSINSLEFDEALKNAKKIQITIREGQK
ncbi:UNVERIFIED_CONTAM: hypothetical protein O8I53_09655 [Campylobacter lari]